MIKPALQCTINRFRTALYFKRKHLGSIVFCVDLLKINLNYLFWCHVCLWLCMPGAQRVESYQVCSGTRMGSTRRVAKALNSSSTAPASLSEFWLSLPEKFSFGDVQERRWQVCACVHEYPKGPHYRTWAYVPGMRATPQSLPQAALRKWS